MNYQWQLNSGAGFNNISGANASSYNIPATITSQNGYQYQCELTANVIPLRQSIGTLTVQSAPAIAAQPVNAQAIVGTTTTFSVAATGTGISYQWQSGPAGAGCTGTWNDIPEPM